MTADAHQVCLDVIVLERGNEGPKFRLRFLKGFVLRFWKVQFPLRAERGGLFFLFYDGLSLSKM